MIYTPLTKKALQICFEAHKEQKDKSNIPYVFHPFMVAKDMNDEDCCVVALLHDVIEDTNITLNDLKQQGFNERQLQALQLLKHDDDIEYFEYIKQIKENKIAKKVKLADLAHNSDLTRFDIIAEKDLKRQAKYLKAINILKDEI